MWCFSFVVLHSVTAWDLCFSGVWCIHFTLHSWCHFFHYPEHSAHFVFISPHANWCTFSCSKIANHLMQFFPSHGSDPSILGPQITTPTWLSMEVVQLCAIDVTLHSYFPCYLFVIYLWIFVSFSAHCFFRLCVGVCPSSVFLKCICLWLYVTLLYTTCSCICFVGKTWRKKIGDSCAIRGTWNMLISICVPGVTS